ncbi:Gfo/Idh/MocA family oxidoreductase [Bdellovibrio sp. HCB-110]|uniref:Gfo/Idh/MocA family oxidoreductase n=1 Tax=Bdellovibrio sp. HCB-110 TaxID=3391182 RepID=UPI0039B5CD8D
MSVQKHSCLVVGAGWMAQEYLRAGKFIPNLQMFFWAPSEKNRNKIEELGGHFSTDLDELIAKYQPKFGVVASSVETLPRMSITLLEKGIQNLLIEKPAFMKQSDGLMLKEESRGRKVFVAFNRRFYASATMALNMIKQNNEKMKSVHFEFTELAADIENNAKFPEEVKNHWALANSSHVIDFGFFPIGLPKAGEWCATQSGKLPWHPSAAEMVGSGVSIKGIPFSYTANWSGVGRWSVEWVTDKTRYIFRPMEKLQVQRLGSFSYEEISLNWKYEGAKHGLVEQLDGFINGIDSDRLLSIEESLKLHEVVSKMANYPI